MTDADSMFCQLTETSGMWNESFKNHATIWLFDEGDELDATKGAIDEVVVRWCDAKGNW